MKQQATVILMMTVLAGAAAYAQTRTFVSGTGDDTNPCSRTQPCKTFAGALSKTPAGAEIDVLDSGGYSAVTITKSITIDGGSSIASVVGGTSTPAITINAGSGAVVRLRGLEISGSGSTADGILIQSAGSVHIEKSRIFGFGGNGVDVAPTSGAVAVSISDTTIHDCTGASSSGVNVDGTNGGASLNADRVEVHGCVFGLHALAGSKASVRDFDFSSNTCGVSVNAGTVTLESGIITFTSTAVLDTGFFGITRLSNITITDNVVGLTLGPASNAAIVSFNNNRIRGNGTDGNPNTTYFLR